MYGTRSYRFPGQGHLGPHQKKLLKEKLSNAPILALPNCEQAFKIECEAYGLGISAMWMQEGSHIAYFSEN